MTSPSSSRRARITVLRGLLRLWQDHAAAHDQPHGRSDGGQVVDRRRGCRRPAIPCSCDAASGTSCRTAVCCRIVAIVDNVATVPVLRGTSKARGTGARARAARHRRARPRDSPNKYPASSPAASSSASASPAALAADPNILLMDEPFGAVDPIVRVELQNELKRLQRELDKTVVFVTHDIDEAFTLGDQVVIFKTGGIVAQVGTPGRDPRASRRRLRGVVHRGRSWPAPRCTWRPARPVVERADPRASTTTGRAGRPHRRGRAVDGDVRRRT